MHGVVVFLDIQQGKGIIDLAGIGVTVIAAGTVTGSRKSGVESRSGIERFLNVVQVPVIRNGTEESEVEGKAFVQHMLGDIDLGGHVLRSHLTNGTVVLAIRD